MSSSGFYLYDVKCANCRVVNNIYIKKGVLLSDALRNKEFFSYKSTSERKLEDECYVEPRCTNCDMDLRNNYEVYYR